MAPQQPNRCSDNPLLTARHLAFPVNAMEMDCALQIRQQEAHGMAGVYWKLCFNIEYLDLAQLDGKFNIFFSLLSHVCM